jgi:uncharacterized membrane protein
MSSPTNPQEEPDSSAQNPESTSHEVVSTSEVVEVVDALRQDPRFKDFSADQLAAVAQVTIIGVRAEVSTSSYRGPLPLPSDFGQYETILPGAGDRILKLAENNANTRLGVNKENSAADNRRADRGQLLGFVLSLVFVASAVICAYLDQPIPASFLGVGGFSSIVSIFVLGKK